MIKLFGDIILDKWIYGINNKISPESACLVLLEKEIKFSLGGAANLALSFKNLNLRSKLFSIIGKDEESKILINLLKKNKINYFIKKTKNCTTVKTRMIGNFNQQIMRLDKENIKQDFLINKMIKKIKKNDVVVISDYNKGFIQNDTIKKILKKTKLVFVDPKQKPDLYKGAYLVKPNMKEYENWNGQFSKKSALKFLKRNKWNWLLITDGSNGMHILNHKNEYRHFKKGVSEVADTTGAGDAVMATLIYGYMHKLDMFESVNLACKVAAKSLGQKLIVAINSDQSVKINKGNNRPVNNVSIRKRQLEILPWVDEVIIFNERTPLNIINEIKPDIIVKGGDYKKKEVIGSKLAQVIIFPFKKNISTSGIIKKLKL